MEHYYSENTKVADIILANPLQMLLLEHFGLNLAVGSKSIKEVCADSNISVNLFLSFVKLYDNEPLSDEIEFTKSDVDSILSYLKSCHNYYLTEKVKKIQEYVSRIISSSGNTNLSMLDNFTNEYISEITEHFNYENNIVFPYMTSLATSSGDAANYSVTEYKQHHTNIDDKLDDLKALLVKYLDFNDTEHLRRKMFQCLYELEFDLKIHSHIEDHILIPLVEKLEKESRQSTSKTDQKSENSITEQECTLSSREIDVLKCLIMGMSNKEVAEKLFISTNTVITHRKNITEKTGIKSLAGLTIFAIVHQLINIDDVKNNA